MAWPCAAMADLSSRRNSLCWPMRTLPIFGPSASIPRARFTLRAARLRKYFASIRTASLPWSSIPRTSLHKPSPLTPKALSTSALLPTARFIASRLPARSPFSSIPKRNTFGTSLFRLTEFSSGRVLRITRSSSKTTAKDSKDSATAKTEGFVLYETSKREVTSLAVASDGTVYVSAIGEKQRIGQAPTTIISTPQVTTTITSGGVIASGQLQPQQAFVPFPPLLSSSIYRISADGAPEELWSSREDVVYALGLASDGRLLAGTGNSGALLAIDGHGVFAHLAKSGSAQITGIARNSAGKVILCTANPGKVYSVGPEYEAEGTFESRSFDAQLFSKWGRLEWWSPPSAAVAKPSARPNEPRLESFGPTE